MIDMVSCNAILDQKIPNVYHFIFGIKPQVEPFHLLHYLCLASCLAVNKPDKIVVHLGHEPWGDLWDLIRPKIELAHIPAGDLEMKLLYHDAFTASFSYAHISDFLRLRILLEHGGVYADMDTLFVAPPPAAFFAESCVMGQERVDTAAPSSPQGSLCNAYIMAQAGAPFLKLWEERMPEAFDGSWSNHSTFLPDRLSRENPGLIRVEPESRFFALDWSREGIAGLFEEDRALPSEAVSLHLWAHLWWSPERRDMSDFSQEQLTPAYVRHARTTYARLARRHLPPGMFVQAFAPQAHGRLSSQSNIPMISYRKNWNKT
jgi:hypothetical protein